MQNYGKINSGKRTVQNKDSDVCKCSNRGGPFFQMVWFLSTLTMWRNVRCLGTSWRHSVMDGRIWMFWVLHSGRICTWLRSRYFLRMAAPSDHSHDYRCLYVRDQLSWNFLWISSLHWRKWSDGFFGIGWHHFLPLSLQFKIHNQHFSSCNTK